MRGLIGSGAQGLCALAAVNVVGAFTGVSLGLNLLSGLSCLVLGVPGVVVRLNGERVDDLDQCLPDPIEDKICALEKRIQELEARLAEAENKNNG